MPIVVFGAAGGLGRRVLAALPPDREVVGIDRDLDPACDIASPDDLSRLLERLPANVVAVNCAGMVATPVAPGDFAELIRSNIQAPAVLIRALADRLDHMVHISSISVYGTPRSNPMTEDHPLAPETAYGISKQTGERLIGLVCSQAGVPLTVIRATQLYGLPSARDTLPHVLARKLSAGESPELTVSAQTRRDYLHVDDAARLIAQAALDPRVGTFNAGSGEGVLLGELFAAGYEAVGRPVPAGRAAGPDTSQWLDTSRARKSFGWEPRDHVLEWVRAVAGGDPEAAEEPATV